MTYNLTLLQAESGIHGLMEFTNYATGELFSSIMVVSLFFILLLSLKRFDFVQAIMASSFVMFLLSLFLVSADLLNFMFPLAFLTFTAMSAIYAYTNNE